MEREVNFRNAATGPIEAAATTTWATVNGTWDDVTGPWSQLNRRRTVAVHTDAVKFAEMDEGTTILGTEFTGTLQREMLGLVGRKRNNEWIVDFLSRKVIRRMWLKMDGGPVTVRVGFAPRAGGATVWGTPTEFDPQTQRYIDVIGSGIAVAVEFSASVPWRLVGYSLEGELAGQH
jgi:hypothetical protein